MRVWVDSSHLRVWFNTLLLGTRLPRFVQMRAFFFCRTSHDSEQQCSTCCPLNTRESSASRGGCEKTRGRACGFESRRDRRARRNIVFETRSDENASYETARRDRGAHQLPMIPLKKRTGSARSARTSIQNASASTAPSGVPSAEMPAALAASDTATHGAASLTTPGDAASQHPNVSPSASENINTSHLFSGSLDAGTRSCFTTFAGSTSQRSMCFTTLPVLLSNACVVPPAAASRGRHGRSSTHENFQAVTRSSSFSSHAVIFRSMSRIMPPRLLTFCLNRSTPSNATNGSLNSQRGSYAASAPTPETKYDES
mmetsp:Transcript_2479/g.10348  ORF Transcript_2479/g.10348 Transcript_2479/m.10348 type:complete len:314 (-) Transcript_2479:490-1431(-)